MNNDRFEKFLLIKPILRALAEEGYRRPTEVQTAAIPAALAGRDLLATAQTGTGKTAAFALPILQRLQQAGGRGKVVRALILTPTRELALQIGESIRAYGRHLPIRTAVILGGVPTTSQIKALRTRPEVLVATPGRLLDLHNQGWIRLDGTEILVLDEADRMLDMGFIRDVRKIVAKTPSFRQTMFFSATLTGDVGRLASDMLRDPTRIEVTPAASVSGDIDQKVLFVRQSDKRRLLTNVLNDESIRRALVFTRTKDCAEFISKILSRGGISADAIHSNKNQKDRQRALSAFDGGKIKVLVATDIVARGIDVDGISHVINYELPENPESYVHRIGRTARAGALGTALSFCDAGEISMLEGIERLTKNPLTTVEDHPYHSSLVATLLPRNSVSRKSKPRRKFGRRSRAGRRYV